MPYDLKGRRVLVTGGSRGLGELICLKFAQEGCSVAVNYNASADRAKGVVEKIQKEHSVKALTIAGDMGVGDDCFNLVKTAIEELGGLDIVISNAGYTRFSTFGDLDGPTNEDWDKCYAVNVKAQMHLMKAVAKTFKSNPDGGAFIITSSIAGGSAGGSSLPYSVTKAAQLHLMKCLAASQGPKIRVNAVMPGLLLTEWTNEYPDSAKKTLAETAHLKMLTNLEDCAQMYIDLAKNTSMTGQKIVVDAGLMPYGMP